MLAFQHEYKRFPPGLGRDDRVRRRVRPLRRRAGTGANELSDGPNAMTGTWEFSNADHDKICRFTFRAEAVAGGYRLDVDRNCANLFPSTKDVIGWALDTYGSLRLLDARGNAVIELTEAETGIFDGFQPGEGRYVLQSAAAAPVRSAEDMVGDWAIARGTGKPICTADAG